MKFAWDFQLCAWFYVALTDCVNLTPDAWELTGLRQVSLLNTLYLNNCSYEFTQPKLLLVEFFFALLIIYPVNVLMIKVYIKQINWNLLLIT